MLWLHLIQWKRRGTCLICEAVAKLAGKTQIWAIRAWRKELMKEVRIQVYRDDHA